MTATVVGGGLAGSEAAWALAERGRRGDAVRDAARRDDPGAPDRPSRRAGLQQLVQIGRARQRPRPAQGRAARARQPAARVRRRGARARRRGARGRSRRLFARRCTRGSTAHPSITVVRGEVADAPRARRSSRPVRSPPSAGRGDRAPGSGTAALAFYDAIAPIVSADSLDHERALRALALRQGRRRRLPERAARRASSTRRSSTALIAARPVSRPRVRRGALLRGLPAGRGDGAARARDAALRADEAGRACPIRAPAASPYAVVQLRREDNARDRCGTWSASRPGSGFPSSSGCSA